jgi:aryl-alcohol dehydrogenase-like predicted oxidoreductase
LLGLAFAWLLAKGAASGIAGATKPGQVQANARATTRVLDQTASDEIDLVLTQVANAKGSEV